MKCPICEGSGELPESYEHLQDEKARRREMARVLHDAGFSLREIARVVGYKSHRSVVMAIEGKGD